MKFLGVFILLAGPLILFSLGIDLLQGFDMDTSLRNAFSPFRVMETPELTVLLFFVFLLAADIVQSFYKKKRKKQKQL